MKNITLKQFRYFEALARHGHFGRAAEASAISQPALSMQIKELEASLGTALIERGARQVRLTSFGDAFSLRVRDILQKVDELGDLVRSQADGLSGRLRLGVIPTIAPYLLPTLIQRLETAYDGLDLHVRETLTPRLMDELSDGRIDAAILALPASAPAFTEVALCEEQFVLIRPQADADKPPPTSEGLSDMRLLLLEEGHCFRDQALAYCNIQSAAPREGLDGTSLSTLVQMVGAGLGVTLLPQMALAVETRSAAITVSKLRGPQPARTLGMIWRNTNPMAEHLLGLSDLVRGCCEALSAAPDKT